MNERLRELMSEAGYAAPDLANRAQKLAELIIKDVVKIIESQQIPVGNSAAGEMAADWTMDALRDCREDIRNNFLSEV